MATYMDEREKQLASQANLAMGSADAATVDLLAILKRSDQAALDRFVKERLYQTVDPVSDAIGKLVDLQIEVADTVHGQSSATYALAQRIGLATLIAGAAALAFALSTVLIGVLRPLSALTGLT